MIGADEEPQRVRHDQADETNRAAVGDDGAGDERCADVLE
jgi:hypothetical protein